MTRALLIVDVQNDFTEGGALACEGGAETAARISRFLTDHAAEYSAIIASRDWHDVDSDNGGHFSETPDWINSWPVHCVAGTAGADYHAAFDTSAVGLHLYKGQGVPAYSAFEGVTADGSTMSDIVEGNQISHMDIVGIATDYCVRESALDAVAAGLAVTVKADLCVGVHPASSITALSELAAAGVTVTIERGAGA